MGANTVPNRSDFDTIEDDWYNDILDALALDQVPRNSSGIATTEAGTLGDAAYPWKRLHIASGGFKVGDIKMRHSYNGLIPVTPGWMLCDGRQINQVNYDAEHGAGSWALEAGDSAISEKYLPDLVNKYARGAATTPADGGSAIPTVGNSGHEIDLSHNHRWYHPTSSGAHDQTFNGSGASQNISGNAKSAGVPRLATSSSGSGYPGTDYYSSIGGNASQNIQPESIEVLFYMRII